MSAHLRRRTSATKIVTGAAGAVRAAQSRTGEAAVRTECRDPQRVGRVRSRGQSGGFSTTSGTGARIDSIVFIGVLQCARSCATSDFVDRDNAEGAVDTINKSAADAFDSPRDRHRICARIAQRHGADQRIVWRVRACLCDSMGRWSPAAPGSAPRPRHPEHACCRHIRNDSQRRACEFEDRAAPCQFATRTGLPVERGCRAPDELACPPDVTGSVHRVSRTERDVRIKARLRQVLPRAPAILPDPPRRAIKRVICSVFAQILCRSRR
jgi:hypothetical protein